MGNFLSTLFRPYNDPGNDLQSLARIGISKWKARSLRYYPMTREIYDRYVYMENMTDYYLDMEISSNSEDPLYSYMRFLIEPNQLHNICVRTSTEPNLKLEVKIHHRFKCNMWSGLYYRIFYTDNKLTVKNGKE